MAGVRCDRIGCKKKAITFGYIDDPKSNGTYLVWLCINHLEQFNKLNNE